MDFWNILLIAVGLAMDAFAVSVCKGTCLPPRNLRQPLRMGFCFGLFQFAMPVLGFFLGTFLAEFTHHFAPWIAFGLLSFIGIKMVVEARKPKPEVDCEPRIPIRELLLLGIATSIDALAVGFSFALLGEPCLLASAVIGGTTFLLAFFGGFFGRKLGELLGRRAEYFGGAVLIIIGVRILIQNFLE